MRLFTNDIERAKRLAVCEGTETTDPCIHYNDSFKIFRNTRLFPNGITLFKRIPQCNDCPGCPISNKIKILNPHCAKHDQL